MPLMIILNTAMAMSLAMTVSEEGVEERGDEALEDGDQLRGPESGQRCQGEGDDTAQSWRHQDHAAETGS